MSQAPTETAAKTDKRLNKRLKDMPIAIVGMASIFANARYLEQFWDLICDKIDAITEVPDSHWQASDYFDADKRTPDKSYCKRGGFMPEVDFNPMEFGLPPNILELTDTSQLLSLVVAKEVLTDANLPDDYDRDRIGITLGVGGGQKIGHSLNARLQYPVLKKVFKNSGISDADSEMLCQKFQDQYIHWEENSFPGSLGNVIAGRIANRFDLGGMNCVVDAACAGSLAAMRMALTELTEGRSDMMITGGVCTDNSPYMYMSFSKTPAFTTNETIQPFDVDSKGMMIGEGIGMVALKRLEDAERDGDRIYAVIKGVGASSDGKFKSIYAPRPEGQAKALERAYDDAGFAPHTLGLIEAHGTGTAAGDVAEFKGLSSVFSQKGGAKDSKQHIALGSVKSQVGHTKSTAGTAGVIKAALALHHKVLPPTINVTRPNPKLEIEDSPFFLNTQTRPWLSRVDGTPRRAGISSFGFGGTNFHLVLEEYAPEHQAGDKYRRRRVPQSLLFAAADKTALLAELNSVLQQTNKTNLQTLANSHPLRDIPSDFARLGLVAVDMAQLQAQLKQAIQQLGDNNGASWQLPSGISYRASALLGGQVPHKVAALFAGQGSQYLNMGIELACHFPEMRAQVSAGDAVFAAQGQTQLSSVLYPIPAFDADAIKAQEARLTNTQNAQSAIGALSMGQYALLTAAGFTADMVAGHSFGELSALCAAGAISQADYYRLAFARGHAMAAAPEGQDSGGQVPGDKDANKAQGNRDSGTMYAILLGQAADRTALHACLEKFADVKIANDNAPTQLVIAGPTEQTREAAKALGEQGFKAIVLPVSGAFHTPLVAHAQQPFAKAIDEVEFKAPTVALYANATGALYPSEPETIKAEFKQHMLQSVRFSEQLRAMYDAGARVFVEFGPKNILGKLVENTLGEHLSELCIVSMNPSPRGDSDQQLRQAAVQLAVAGVSLSEPDPYQAEVRRPDAPSAMNIKLSASNHISAATRAKMAASLATGEISPRVEQVDRIVEKLVEKIVEKEVFVDRMVEKVVEVEKQTNKMTDAMASTTGAQMAATTTAKPQEIGAEALNAFFAAQAQAAQLHQQFLSIPQQYGETFSALMTEQAKMASQGIAIPESLQRSMELFHQHQAQTLKSHAEFMQLQAGSSQAALAMLGNAPRQAVTIQTATQQAESMPSVAMQAAPARVAPVQAVSATPVQVEPEHRAPAPVLATTAGSSDASAPAASASATISAQAVSQQQVQEAMLSVVADKTGYPVEMLELSMDMEADLGIDSIKRVEILGTVQDALPGLPELSPEDLAECRTLEEITSLFSLALSQSQSQLVSQPGVTRAQTVKAPTTAAAQSQNLLGKEQVQQTMMAVVADKTGYPVEMLELSMDMEADLGIDSIKRVEILGTVQDALPELPELSPEDLAECRTLGEIVELFSLPLSLSLGQNSQSQLASQSSVTRAQTINTPNQNSLGQEQVQQTMMAVVADKTGYPVEMLELTMDMEADLGIDSIKRVEILGTVQDQLPELPELSPEDLAECRTLGEIVELFSQSLSLSLDQSSQSSQSQPASQPAASAPAAATAMTAQNQNALGQEQVQQAMLSVVADKTGYPVEMLELTMDMEADLGIDSIKRVEILGTVQDQLPELPELSPEDLAECRTLGEIVELFSRALGQSQEQTPGQTSADYAGEATVHEANTFEAEVALPPHSEVTLKKLPAAAILTLQETQQGTQETESAPEPWAEFAENACILINDDGHNAGVLAEKLYARGLKVAVVRAPGTLQGQQSPLSSNIASFTLEAVDDASVLAVLAEAGSLGPIAGFIHLQPQHKAQEQQQPQGLMLSGAALASVEQAFLFAKHLQAPLTQMAGTGARASFVTASRIDGGFGYLDSEGVQSSELNQAALSGLTKTLSQEWPDVHCRALDLAPSLDAKHLADALVAELFATEPGTESGQVEVGVSLDASGMFSRATLVAGTARESHAPASLESTDKILVTGGAKGVTLECALALAKHCQAHFILAGRSKHQAIPAWAEGKIAGELKAAAIAHIKAMGDKPTPKQVDALVWEVQSSLEISAALAAFETLGASAEYLSLDVNDRDAIDSSLGPITALSPITGIIHGAGVLADKHIQNKTLDELTRVYGTKVSGLSQLLAALDLSRLKLLALFSSAAGFYGNTGQSDYAMANEILNKAALQLSRQLPGAKVMSFNWGPWDGGMVSPALKQMFMARGVYVIPLKAGARLFADKLLGQGGTQLLIGSDMQGTAAKVSGTETEESEAKKSQADLTASAADPQALLSINSVPARLASAVTLTRTLDPAAMPFIEDHRINASPVLPTVCAIQWMREAAKQLLGVPVRVLDYKLLKGVIFEAQAGQTEKEPAPQTLQLTLTPAGDGQINALISCQDRPQYQAVLSLAPPTALPASLAGDALPSPGAAIVTDAGGTLIAAGSDLYQDGTLFHGPRLQGIESIVQFDDAGLVAKICLPKVALADCGDFAPSLVPGGAQPFAEDLLLQAMLVWARLKYGAASLPSTIGEFISHAPMSFGDGGSLVLEVVKHSGRMLEANIALYHGDGRLSCEMRSARVTISKGLNAAFLNTAKATPAQETSLASAAGVVTQ
ncbi:phosphopantetheine-binding protein [Shewanella sp. AS16]|uniref:type I polyketide synthase n=1 Tax=Shewanella sp. AS16 TaxID=2907625 RepID=UPI001F308BDA|nr:type I polyketide synthase [Shewanella sp. AS16]MCE9685128.1 phosphopantetheine-binding protein [Shewanella sp. AS16]